MAVFNQNGQVSGQLRASRHRWTEGRSPADGCRPNNARHHAGRPPEEDHEQHPGHASTVFEQPVRGLSRLTADKSTDLADSDTQKEKVLSLLVPI